MYVSSRIAYITRIPLSRIVFSRNNQYYLCANEATHLIVHNNARHLSIWNKIVFWRKENSGDNDNIDDFNSLYKDLEEYEDSEGESESDDEMPYVNTQEKILQSRKDDIYNLIIPKHSPDPNFEDKLLDMKDPLAAMDVFSENYFRFGYKTAHTFVIVILKLLRKPGWKTIQMIHYSTLISKHAGWISFVEFAIRCLPSWNYQEVEDFSSLLTHLEYYEENVWNLMMKRAEEIDRAEEESPLIEKVKKESDPNS